LFKERAQPVEPCAPEAVLCVHPAQRGHERAALHVHAMQAPVAFAHDEPGVLEHAHVPGDGGRRHAERFGQLAHARRPRGQPLEHATTSGVGERAEHGVERVGLTVNHVVKC
jgi:hypothetical protein